MFWVTVGDVKRKWRRLNNEKFFELYFSPNIILVKESREIKWE
jgi:hypothetical protein